MQTQKLSGKRPDDRRSLAERIRSELEADITNARVLPGSVLDESELTERFGASRTPVREAIRQLEAIGLVGIRPRKGIIVLPMTQQRLSDLFEASAEFEALCVRLATYRMGAVERSDLTLLVDQADMVLANGDMSSYDELNLRFHEAINRGTHNAVMFEQAMQLHTRLNPFRHAELGSSDRILTANAEHREVVRAMTRGDGDEAAACMRAHLLNGASAWARHFAETDSGFGD